jgi:hypothetical protein
MAEETRKTYTIRLPEQVAAGLETQAETLGVTPTTLIQSLIARQFGHGEGAGATDLIAALSRSIGELRKSTEMLERMEAERYGQLLFEIAKTRSALFHSLDQTLSAQVVDEIIETSEKTAHEYIGGLANPAEKPQ